MSKNKFIYIWEYTVKDQFLTEFTKAYGPNGDWVHLFNKSNSYLGTELHRDISNPNRFLTVDSWKSKADRDNFRIQFSKEYDQLDDQCERYTVSERLIGDFVTLITD